MLSTVTKQKGLGKIAGIEKPCCVCVCVCAVKSVGEQNAIALQSSRFNSMKKSSNFRNALRERSQMNFVPS
jgi:hypothetical protein